VQAATISSTERHEEGGGASGAPNVADSESVGGKNVPLKVVYISSPVCEHLGVV